MIRTVKMDGEHLDGGEEMKLTAVISGFLRRPVAHMGATKAAPTKS